MKLKTQSDAHLRRLFEIEALKSRLAAIEEAIRILTAVK